MAFNVNGHYRNFDGSGWSRSSDVKAEGIVSVACPADGTCMAVSDYGSALHYVDGHWTPYQHLGNDFSSVSCLRATLCVAMDGFSYVYREASGRAAPE